LRAHGQVAGQFVQVLTHADALQLALASFIMRCSSSTCPCAAWSRRRCVRSVGAHGNVLKHRHVGNHLDVLEGARHARRAIPRAGKVLMS
jgi:hypothetical protein